MTQLIGQGGTITLDATYADLNGTAKDPTTPQVSILDPNGDTIVSLATPTRVSLGHYQYQYEVASDALQGAWEARWYGLINGVQVGPVTDGFTVAAAGAIVPGASPGSAVCMAWATHEDVLGTACEAADPDLVDDACLVASDMLYELTGRRWPGICTDKVRPQAQWRKADGPPQWWPALPTSPFGFCSCHRGRETGCAPIPEIRLPHGPVVKSSVIVKIDGEVFEEWRLDDRRYLTRLDGDRWPCCQDLLLEDDAVNTWSIEWQWGARPPIGGKMAAAALGCQLALAYDPSTAGQCALPAKTQSITRAGTTIRMIDPATLLEKGLTGFAPVDQWVNSVLVGRKRQPPTMIIPGRHRGFRRTQ